MTIEDDITPKEDRKVMDFVTDYMKRIRNGELVIDSKMAQSITRFLPNGYSHPLGMLIASSLTQFRESDDYDNFIEAARDAKRWIEEAWDQGIISEGNGLIGKHQECEKERIRLENELTLLSKKFELLDEKYQTALSEIGVLREKLYRDGVKQK